MTVRAKFRCYYKDEHGKGDVVFEVVTAGSEENQRFFKQTPSGLIRLGVVSPEALKQFEEGQEYYIDFTPASTDTADTK